MIKYFYLLAMVFSVSCQKNSNQLVIIDTQMEPIFDLFVQAAAERGIVVDFQTAGIEAIFSDTDEGVNGQCQHRTNAPDRIIVNRDFWSNATAMEKEFLIFHELGHCYLGRSHLDERTSNGICVSMMHSSAGICRNTYGIETRDLFWDELFNQ